jgi:tRNA(adenine34) deaminase
MNKKEWLFLGMNKAIEAAQKGFLLGEIPIGASAYMGSQWIISTHNEVESLKKPWAHAELMLLETLHKMYQVKYFPHITVYVTLEPCALCWHALFLARIKQIVFGAYNAKYGCFLQRHAIFEKNDLNIIGGVQELQCTQILSDYFHILRK